MCSSQKFLSHRAFQSGQTAGGLQFQLFEENLATERVAVGVQAARRDADDRVPCPDGFLAVEHLRFFNHANDRAAHVVFALRVKTGHLRRLAAEKGAVVFRTGTREALDDFGEHVRLQFAGAQVIEEKQRLGPEDGDVVDAMVHEVGADGVVFVHGEGNLELGADTIHGRNEHGLAVTFDVESEEAAEAADLAEDFRPVGGGEQLRQGCLDLVPQIDIHTRPSVSFLFHAPGD